MFVAMAFCLPIGTALRAQRRRQQRHAAAQDGSAPLLDSHQHGGASRGRPACMAALRRARGPHLLQLQAHTGRARAEGEDKHTSIRSILLLALPMAFDLVATLLMSVGLLYVTASIYQMLRGAEILFSALFAVLFLHRPLNKQHYLGIAACTVGIVIVGSSSLLGSGKDKENSGNGGGDANASQVLLGMALIVVAQVHCLRMVPSVRQPQSRSMHRAAAGRAYCTCRCVYTKAEFARVHLHTWPTFDTHEFITWPTCDTKARVRLTVRKQKAGVPAAAAMCFNGWPSP